MNTLLAILKGTDARCDVILAGGLCHRFPWTHFPPPPPPPPPVYSLCIWVLGRKSEQKAFAELICAVTPTYALY